MVEEVMKNNIQEFNVEYSYKTSMGDCQKAVWLKLY